MKSRERLIKTINHQDPGKVVVDLGSTVVTGISASALNKLRKKLGLEERLVKVYDPFQMLGEVEEDIRQVLDIDVVGVSSPITTFGFINSNWKQWKMFDETPVLISDKFLVKVDIDESVYVYPQGDTNVSPSAKMPKNGYYFDNIVRNNSTETDRLDAKRDFLEDFKLFSEETLRIIEEQANYYYHNTDYGLNGGPFICGIGDLASLPGPGVKNPQGIRSAEEWLIAHYTLPNYIKDVYDYQLEIGLKNLQLFKEAVGDKIQVIQISGTDFGTQKGEFISPDLYREFYKPYHKKLNDWVHQHTNWKTFYHTCGSIVKFLDDFVDCGIDIINPVQTSAAGMSPGFLKEKYGDKLVFWGGGIDTQKVLPFGTPEEVREHTKERLKIFAPGGGFVFNTIHNIQQPTPVENIIAMFEGIKEYNNLKN